MSKIDQFAEADDPQLVALRQQMMQIQPHRPQPGDPDYQTPAQIAQIKKRLKRQVWT